MPTVRQSKAVVMRQAATLDRDFRIQAYNPVVWLDEGSDMWQDDGSTPADEATDPVGRWDDRSGNGFHAVGTGDERPLLVDQGGVLVPNFDGDDQEVVISNDTIFSELDVFTYAIRVTAGSLKSQRLWFWGGDFFLLGASTGGFTLTVDGDSMDAQQLTAINLLAADTDSWFFVSFDNNGDRYARLFALIDSAYQVAPVNHIIPLLISMVGDYVYPTGDLYVGGSSSSGGGFDGIIRAFMIFPSFLDGGDMRWIAQGI